MGGIHLGIIFHVCCRKIYLMMAKNGQNVVDNIVMYVVF